MNLLQLFFFFFRISAVTFGGGIAILGMVKLGLAERKDITELEFSDMLSLAASVPGPLAVSMAWLLGKHYRGIKGSIAAVAGAVIPPFLIVLFLSPIILRYSGTPQVQGFFKKPVDHLYAQDLLCAYARYLGIVDDNLVVVSPDAGSAKRARMMANELGCAVAIGDKTRTGHDENAKVLEIIGDVKGKNCIVVDDFTISGGTLVDVAHGLKDKGANDIYAFLSHVVLREKGVKKIEESPIKLLVSTDTVNCPAVKGHDKIKILSAAPMFAEAVRHIHDRMSMSNLFDNPSQRMLTMSFAKQMSLDDMMNLHK